MNILEKLGFLEDSVVEFKEILEEKKVKSWLKTVSAFANSMGGHLMFGISNVTREVAGIKNIQHAIETISDKINKHINPLPIVNINQHKIEDKYIIEVDVKSGPNTPYYLNIDNTNIAFIRNGSSSIVAPNHILHELILKGTKQSFDSMVSTYKKNDFSFSVFEATYLEQTKERIRPSDYVSFGMMTPDGFLTNAGRLFADQHNMYNSRVFCTRWHGLEKGSIFDDVTDDKEFEGNIINLLKQTIEFIKMNSRISFRKQNFNRLNKYEYSERAIMEAIVNALIHRSYTIIGSEIHVDMFDDRIEIISPGGYISGENIQNKDIFNIESIRRNPIIADIFHRLRFMERRGTGLKDILIETSNLVGYKEEFKPIFISSNNFFKIIVKNINYAKNEPLNGKNEPLNAKNEPLNTENEPLNAKNEPLNLDDISLEILSLLRANPALSKNEISNNLKISLATTKRRLDNLIKLDIIERCGSKKKGYWSIKK